MQALQKTIIFLYKNKMKPDEIAEKLKINVSGVYKAIKTNNLQTYKTSVKNLVYQSENYQTWRTAVLERDGKKCIKCGRKNSRTNPLQVDHIIPKSLAPEKAFDVNNGRTLCLQHHKTTESYGRTGIRKLIKRKK